MSQSSSRRQFVGRAFGCASLFGLQLQAADAFKIGMVPDAGATQVSVEQKAPLREYLSKKLGSSVDLIIPTNYNATVEGLGNGSLDFAYLGALTYVKARQRYGVQPVVQRDVDRSFHSLFITQADSPIQKLTDVKGKQFAFGDINSTSGHLIPYQELREAGVNVDQDLQFRYTGSHAATLKAVESGASNAGALDETVYNTMISEAKVDRSKVRVFHTSRPFVDYVWVARREVAPARCEAFAQAFLSLTPGKDKAVLEILRGNKFVRAEDAEYSDIRKVAAELKLL